MPSIQTLVNDLNAGTVGGIGRKPASTSTTTSFILSDRHKIKFKNLNIKASISANVPRRLSCDAATSIDINGTYLHFEDSWSTITKIDVLRPIAISGNFSGCAYHVYKGEGTIICCHIARPGGDRAEENVSLMREYADNNGWALLHDMGTKGRIGNNGCSEVVIVSQLIGRRICSIRLEVTSQGIIVAKTLVQSNV